MKQTKKQITVTVKVPKGWDRAEIRRRFNAVAEPVEVQTIKLPMRPGGGVAKGRRNEAGFAKELSLWWSRGEDDCVFSHRAGSGGRFRDKIGTSSHSGDIQAEKEIGRPFTEKYSIELKSVKDATGDIWSLICHNTTKTLGEFWAQCTEAAEPYSRLSILVIRTNQRPPIVITNDSALAERYHGWFREIDGDEVGVFPLDDLFNDFGLVTELRKDEAPRRRKGFARIT